MQARGCLGSQLAIDSADGQTSHKQCPHHASQSQPDAAAMAASSPLEPPSSSPSSLSSSMRSFFAAAPAAVRWLRGRVLCARWEEVGQACGGSASASRYQCHAYSAIWANARAGTQPRGSPRLLLTDGGSSAAASTSSSLLLPARSTIPSSSAWGAGSGVGVGSNGARRRGGRARVPARYTMVSSSPAWGGAGGGQGNAMDGRAHMEQVDKRQQQRAQCCYCCLMVQAQPLPASTTPAKKAQPPRMLHAFSPESSTAAAACRFLADPPALAATAFAAGLGLGAAAAARPLPAGLGAACCCCCCLGLPPRKVSKVAWPLAACDASGSASPSSLLLPPAGSLQTGGRVWPAQEEAGQQARGASFHLPASCSQGPKPACPTTATRQPTAQQVKASAHIGCDSGCCRACELRCARACWLPRRCSLRGARSSASDPSAGGAGWEQRMPGVGERSSGGRQGGGAAAQWGKPTVSQPASSHSQVQRSHLTSP